MWNINPIAAAIRQGKLESIDNYLVTNREDGMISMDESVAQIIAGGEDHTAAGGTECQGCFGC